MTWERGARKDGSSAGSDQLMPTKKARPAIIEAHLLMPRKRRTGIAAAGIEATGGQLFFFFYLAH